MKILHLTDIHIGGGWLSGETDALTINAVAAMVVQKSLTLLLLQVTLPTLCLMNLWHLTTCLLTQFLQLLWSLLVFIGFILFKKSQKIGLVVTVLLIVGFVFVEKNVMKLDVIFYDTILCFPLGMIFAVVKPFVDKIL